MEAWYNANLFSNLVGVVLGFILSSIASLVSNYFNNRNQRKEEIKNLLLLLMQSNSELFSLIYQGAMDRNKLDYIKLREYLKKNNIIFVLPQDLKVEFKKLYEIYLASDYESKKHLIYPQVVKINKVLDEYGVELFGN